AKPPTRGSRARSILRARRRRRTSRRRGGRGEGPSRPTRERRDRRRSRYPRSVRDVTEAILAVLDGGGRGALATVVRASGSTPQQVGARLLLRPDGTCVGTVGGGAIEHAVLEELRACAVDGRPRLVVKDLLRDLGMCCGGRMEVLVEPIEGSPRLVLFGAGHVAKPTAALARTLGFRVLVADDREDLNTEERFPGCERVLAEPEEAAIETSERDWPRAKTHAHP